MKIEEAYRKVFDCPFCGSRPLIETDGNFGEVVWISCNDKKCKVNTYLHGNYKLKEAIEIWNKRA